MQVRTPADEAATDAGDTGWSRCSRKRDTTATTVIAGAVLVGATATTALYY